MVSEYVIHVQEVIWQFNHHIGSSNHHREGLSKENTGKAHYSDNMMEIHFKHFSCIFMQKDDASYQIESHVANSEQKAIVAKNSWSQYTFILEEVNSFGTWVEEQNVRVDNTGNCMNDWSNPKDIVISFSNWNIESSLNSEENIREYHETPKINLNSNREV